jgi:DNA-binding NarL/FixJ family response regulator
MSHKILIVDDSKLARMAVIKALNALRPQWTRVEAASAEEALKAMQESAPDVALLDFNMPGQDGLDLAADLRKSRPDMPVGVISANHQQGVLSRTLAIGATFLPKPLTEEVLGRFLIVAEQRLEKDRK